MRRLDVCPESERVLERQTRDHDRSVGMSEGKMEPIIREVVEKSCFASRKTSASGSTMMAPVKDLPQFPYCSNLPEEVATKRI